LISSLYRNTGLYKYIGRRPALAGNEIHTVGNLPAFGCDAIDENGKAVYAGQLPEIEQKPDYDAALTEL
jgi:hypothetical protein